jgi:programmed cell death 6-interacting protein
LLDDEERTDAELRAQFRERWTRSVSSTLTGPLRYQAKQYMDMIGNAINSDQIVQNNYRINRDSIALLDKPTVGRP